MKNIDCLEQTCILAPVSIHQSFAYKVFFTSGVKRTGLKIVSAELDLAMLTLDFGIEGPPFLGLGGSIFL